MPFRCPLPRVRGARTFSLVFSMFALGCPGDDAFSGAEPVRDAGVAIDTDGAHDEEDDAVDSTCPEDVATGDASPDEEDAPAADAEAADADAEEEDAESADDGERDADSAEPSVDPSAPEDGGVDGAADAGEPDVDASNNMPWATITTTLANGSAPLSLRAFNLATRITHTGESFSEWIVMVRNDGELPACSVSLGASFYDWDGFERLRAYATADAAEYRDDSYYYSGEMPCIGPGETVPAWGQVTMPAGLAITDLDNIYVSLSGFPAGGYYGSLPTRLAGYELSELRVGTRAGNPLYTGRVTPTAAYVQGSTLKGVRVYPLNAGGMPLDRIVVDPNTLYSDAEPGRLFDAMSNRKHTAASVFTALGITVPRPCSYPYSYPYGC